MEIFKPSHDTVVTVEWKGQTIAVCDTNDTADTFIEWYSQNCVVPESEDNKKDFSKTKRFILTLKK